MSSIKTTRSLAARVPQTIRFSGSDEDNSIEVTGSEVVLVPSSGDHVSGSSKVKLKNIVDFSWELQYYTGQLLAVHMTGKYVAYGISVGKGNGVVRVVNRVNNERSLLKGMKGIVRDIAFAHIPHEVILACVDEFGNLLVHSVQEVENKMVCTQLLHVQHRDELTKGMAHRVIWCPFISDDEESSSSDSPNDDDAKLLVLTLGCKAELWKVGVVAERYGDSPLYAEDVEEGFLQVHEHTQPIVDAAFSPDGAALATASLDGEVKFFQVYMSAGETPRCLHQWQPHGGKAVSSLFFLDDHETYKPEVQFWKYAMTGANYNTELKLWSCESWTCLQTLRFSPENPKKKVALKAGLDRGAGYLLLSDIYNRVLYILQIYKNDKVTFAHIHSITEFCLPYPILSFGIVDAGLRNIRSSSFEDLCIEDGDDDTQASVQAVVIRMYLVQPKSLQECHIAFQPPAGPDLEKIGSLSCDSLVFKDSFSDISQSLLEKPDLNVSLKEIPMEPSTQLTLMTPDAFSSPAKKDSPGKLQSPRVSHSSPHIQAVIDTPLAASPTLLGTVVSPKADNHLASCAPTDNGPLATSEPVEAIVSRGFASGGSSPSREVQEILALKTSSEFLPDNTEVLEKVMTLPAKISPPKDQFGTAAKEKGEGDGWAQIPLARVSDVRKSVAAEDDSSRKRSSAVGPGGDTDALVQLVAQMGQFCNQLKTIGDQVSSFTQSQNRMLLDIHNLQNGMQRVEEQQVSAAAPSHAYVPHLEVVLAQQQGIIVDAVRSVVEGQVSACMQALERRERIHLETTLSKMSQMLDNVVSARLQEVVSSEFNNTITPLITNLLEGLKNHLHSEVTLKLSAIEHALKENMLKLVQSKSLIEMYSSAMSREMQPIVSACFKNAFINVILPSFEKAVQNMFQQISAAITKGTKEYIQTVESCFEKQRREQEQNLEAQNPLHGLTEALHTNFASLATPLCQEVRNTMETQLAGVESSVNQTVADAVKEHMSRGFLAQKAVIEDSVITAVRSRAPTPAPHLLETQLQQSSILQLIAQGQINAAFQQALSASDLSLVIFVCEKVNPAQMFNQTPCPLQQPVLLSLVQQLSSDLANHTELKLEYLSEAVMNLDTTDGVTREHLPDIINSLRTKLVNYMTSNPSNKLSRKMRMLYLATQSFVGS